MPLPTDDVVETFIKNKFPQSRRPPLWARLQLLAFRLLHPFGVHLMARRFRAGESGIFYDLGVRCMFCER